MSRMMRQRALKQRQRSRRWRHSMDQGTPLVRWTISVLQLLNDNRSWSRHPAPFAKTAQGRARRAARQFKTVTREELFQ